MRLQMLCGTSLVLLLALSAPAAGQSGTFDSSGNTSSGEGSTRDSAPSGGGTSQSGAGTAPTATPAPPRPHVVVTPAPRVVVTPGPTAAPRAMAPTVRRTPTATATPDRAASRARAREERESNELSRRAARVQRDAARSKPVSDPNAAEGTVEHASNAEPDPAIELQPAPAAADAVGSRGADVTLPLLLVAAAVVVAVASRHALRSLHNE